MGCPGSWHHGYHLSETQRVLWLPAVATCCGYHQVLQSPRPLASQPSRRGNPRGARGPRRLRLPCWCEQLDAGMVARHRRTKKGRSVALSRGVCPKI